MGSSYPRWSLVSLEERCWPSGTEGQGFRNGHYQAALTMVFFVAAMRLSQALELYLDDLKGTAAAISHDLSNPVPMGHA